MGTRTHQVFQSVARTANLSSPQINARDAETISFEIEVTALTGTSVTFTIQDYDVTVGAWKTLLASAAQTGAARIRLTIGTTSPTTANVSLNCVPPPQLRVTTTGTWNPATFSCTAQLHRP